MRNVCQQVNQRKIKQKHLLNAVLQDFKTLVEMTYSHETNTPVLILNSRLNGDSTSIRHSLFEVNC